ncbi:PIR protein CIR protein [Plasmodium vinckei lentum]|uniref:PIR protein CIR protein n=1 Tax=Plasmodium vinckei lentum TaxID=138297 RepID=A0A6V7S5L0_PLAVN|nr:PIR protein CIR protein [Plasmodium vinckei lentum]
MAIKACKLLREADAYFKNESVDVAKFDSNKDYFKYKCPYDKKNKEYPGCKNNNERINAVGVDLYENLVKIANKFKGEGDNGNRHIEIFIMWLSDKLYKLEKNKIPTLEESYKNNLEKHTGNYKYWNVLDSKKEYKRANVWYMSEFYSLLNCICNIVIEYNKNPNSRQIGTISKKCHKKFKNIYNNIKDCYSYFHLLKFLKIIYDNIRNDAIKRDNDLKANIRKAAIRRTIIRSNAIKQTNITQKTYLNQLLRYAMSASTISLVDLTTSDWNQRFPDESDQIIDFNTQACVNSYSEFVEQVKKNAPKDIPEAQPQPENNQLGSDKPGSGQSGNDQSGKEGNKKPSDHSKVTQNKHAENSHSQKQQTQLQAQHQASTSLPTDPKTPDLQPTGLQTTDPQSTDSQSIDTQPTDSHPTDQQSPPELQKQDSPSLPQPPNQPTDNLQKTSSPSASEPDLGNNQEDSDKSPKDPSSGQADSENIKLLRFLIGVQNTFEKYRSPFYNAYAEIKKRVNESISSALKNGHNNSIYIGNKVNNAIKQLSEQLQKASTPAKETKDPQDHKKPEPKSPPSSSTGSQTPNSQPTNPSTNTSLNGQNDASIYSSNLMTNSVTDAGIKESTQKVILLGNIFKGGIPTYVKAIVILIPVILGIMYKYLSLWCTSRSKKKKSMKKVINSIEGGKPVQIIIKSFNMKKTISPIINPVRGGKKSSLNIYKLMQADPVPFINLFFLLIFFVYKRKLNYLEL